VLPDPQFVIGANLPWIRYGCDFGANAWHPRGGVSEPGMTLEVRRLFARLAAQGVSAIRWFLFCDGRAGIRFDTDGTPQGLDDRALPDLDAALTLASEARLGIMFTLFDFSWCHPCTEVGGVRLGGHRRVFAQPTARAALLDAVLAPVFDRCARHPAICAWDVINEPEWVTFGRGGWDPRRTIRSGAMRAFVADVVRLVHERTIHPATVGLASARWLRLVRGLGLDFYQVHWYDRLDWLGRLDAPVERWKLDKPVVLGEFPTRGSSRDPAAILELARARGYAGAFFWSARASDDASDEDAGARALDRFAALTQAEAPPSAS
jgi:hypothetical protein